MTRPDDGSTTPDAGATEPGHRARAYAAALLGELTGGRRTGFGASPERDPRDPSAVPDLAASTLVTRGEGPDRGAAQQEGSEDATAAAPGDGGPADLEPGAADPYGGPEAAGQDAVQDAIQDAAHQDAPTQDAAHQDAATQDATDLEAPTPDATGQDATGQDATGQDATGQDATGQDATGQDTGGPGLDAPETADPVSLASDEAPHARAAEEPLVGDAASLDAPSGASLAGGSPAVDGPPTATRVEAPGAALVGTPVRTDAVLERTASAPAAHRGPRPSPFTYVEVAAHHTGPARTRAGAVLDSVGGQFSSRADREQVRRAARTAVEAAALLDACDALDARAAAVDATWNGERHGATEVREFEGAWGAFYDTSSALSSSA